jgi:hypothetical protein
MPGQSIEVPYLDFLYQLQVLFAHFEKNLYIPSFAVQSNDFFAIQGCICRKKCKPATLFIARKKDDSGILAGLDVFIADDTLEKILAGKGQVENNGKDCQQSGPLGFGNSGSIEHAADFKFGEDIVENA